MNVPTLSPRWASFGRRRRTIALPLPGTSERARRARVVFLHGWGSRPDNGLIGGVIKQLQAQGANLDVVAPWLRPAEGAHTMADQLIRARAALAAEPGPVILVGHSFGGEAALALAKEFPGKVQAVVALAPSLDAAREFWRARTGSAELPARERFLEEIARRGSELEGALWHLAPNDPALPALQRERAGLALYVDALSYDARAIERDVPVPTVVLQGTADPEGSLGAAESLAAANPGRVRVVAYAKEGHCFGHHFKEIARELLGMLPASASLAANSARLAGSPQ